MPRGIPNAKRDETGLRYTTFHVPLLLNPKHGGSTYLKSENTVLWNRNAAKKAKAAEEPLTLRPGEETLSLPNRRGSSVLVIHPGSRNLRIGRARDVNPVTVPHVLARKTTVSTPPTYIEGISRPRIARRPPGEEENNVSEPEDPFDEKLSHIESSLRDRMEFYKLRITPNSTNVASSFNDSFKPELIPEHNDPYRVDWITSSSDDYLVGEKALRLADPLASGYVLRWPIYGSNFNTRDYPSLQVTLSDIEIILRTTLKEHLDIEPHDYKNFSVILVIPDFYDRTYVRNFVHLLLVCMGFKQICCQQESLAASFGAGVSSACVVDIGAKTTNIACVDEGLVLADTRMSLNIGGDDITEFLWVLLERICFPYRDLNLARSYDWQVMEDLKTRLCSLAESDVALNLYDFVVRKPGQPAEKYGLRAYDEIILAPMCLFEPRVVEFDRKRIGLEVAPHPEVLEGIMEVEHMTSAMMISTQHLLPPSPSSAAPPKDGKGEGQEAGVENSSTNASGDVPMDVEGDDEGKGVTTKALEPAANSEAVQTNRGYSIDVVFEASKLPLDVAIFNCARAAGGDEKIRKYLQAVLVIGGSALISGMGHALESRLQAIATPLIQNMEKVQVIPPPKGVDPRVLAWKGAAVLGKMEGVSELWVTASDWDLLGMRGLKERCFFL